MKLMGFLNGTKHLSAEVERLESENDSLSVLIGVLVARLGGHAQVTHAEIETLDGELEIDGDPIAEVVDIRVVNED